MYLLMITHYYNIQNWSCYRLCQKAIPKQGERLASGNESNAIAADENLPSNHENGQTCYKLTEAVQNSYDDIEGLLFLRQFLKQKFCFCVLFSLLSEEPNYGCSNIGVSRGPYYTQTVFIEKSSLSSVKKFYQSSLVFHLIFKLRASSFSQ